MKPLSSWEPQFIAKIKASLVDKDPAHDLAHFSRVVKTAKHLCHTEQAELAIVVPAAWLHDLVNVPKNHPDRKLASRYSADAAVEFLKEIDYPENYFQGIYHAIHAHSFSAQVPLETLEAKIVQDADRLDALGAIGMARCFTVGGKLDRDLYDFNDPFCERKDPQDEIYTIDHFYKKLFKVATTLQTAAGKEEGALRVTAISRFLEDLRREIM